jgi:hypothetical protein
MGGEGVAAERGRSSAYAETLVAKPVREAAGLEPAQDFDGLPGPNYAVSCA